MAPDISPAAVTVVVGFIAVATFLRFSRSSSRRYAALPPGPKPHWFYGNRIVGRYPWRYFETLTKEYGPLFTFWIGRRPLVVVGTFKEAWDIMERQGGSSPSRPSAYYASDIVSGGMRILLTPYGDRWRRLRKAIHNNLQPAQAITYEPIQEKAASNLLKDILENPDCHQEHARRYAASVILTVTYGKRTPTSYADPEVMRVNEGAARLNSITKPGSLMIDYVPWLRYMPGYTSLGKKWHRDELKLFRGQFDGVRAKLAEHDCDPCFASYLIENQPKLELTDNESAYIAGSMFGAGSDTTASAISISIMAAVMFPQAQRRVQEELDRVVGHSRPPTFQDWADLPYMSAYCREVFRWRPVSSGGFLHMTIEDIAYGQYVIPKDTAIVGNHWSIHRDPAVFPEPDEFRPERWLKEQTNGDGQWEPSTDKNLRHFTFGFGRRVCPGQHVADRSVYITVSRILWAFNLSKKKDGNGKEIDIDTLAFTPLANSHPLDGMPVHFEPRFGGVAKQIQSMAAWDA